MIAGLIQPIPPSEENAVWRDLIVRQDNLLPGRAVPVVLRTACEILDLPRDAGSAGRSRSKRDCGRRPTSASRPYPP